MCAWETSAKLSGDSWRFIGFVCFFLFRVYLRSNTETANLFHLALELLSLASQLSFFLIVFLCRPLSFSSPVRFPFSSVSRSFSASQIQKRIADDKIRFFLHLLQAPYALTFNDPCTASRRAKKGIRNQRTANNSECHQH